jgi:hypothetical protein
VITVLPSAEIALDHRAYHLAVAESGHLLASSREGECSLIAPNFSLLKSFHLSEPPTGIALDPVGSIAAIATPRHMRILDVLHQQEVASFNGSFEAAAFGPHGRVLWSVRRLADDLISLEVHDGQTWRLISETQLLDVFGESSFYLYLHPQGDCVSLFVAAGQDGQAIFFARSTGTSIDVARFTEVDYTTAPSFDRDGNSFLILVQDTLRHYSFPDCRLLGSVRCPEDEVYGYDVQFARDHHALMQWGEARLYLIDVHSYSILDEVSIRGHEPRRIAELYPSLKDDLGIGSDLYLFQPMSPDTFISVHQYLPASPDRQKRCSLLAWNAPEIRP